MLRDAIVQNAPLPAGPLGSGPRIAADDAEPARPAPLPFVGRAAELAQLRAAWNRAARAPGRGGVVLLGGEAGVGKTRLSAELAQQAEAEGAGVLWGPTTVSEPVPYQALAAALRSALPLVAALDIVPIWLAAVAALIPELRARRPDLPLLSPLEADRQQTRLFEAVARVLAALSQPRPVLLIIDLYLKLAVPYTVVGEAFGSACPNYSAATTAPNVAGFVIGQTASVGNLRMTLDKVVEAPLNGGNFPTLGNRYLLVYTTITNTGKDSLQVTGLSETSFQDKTGNTYDWDPSANVLDASGKGLESIDALIPAGGTHVGIVGYQLPKNAGDLIWIFRDYGNNQAVFAVKASNIDTSGAVSAPTEDALRLSAGATQTAFMDMVNTAQAAAPTDTPAP